MERNICVGKNRRVLSGLVTGSLPGLKLGGPSETGYKEGRDPKKRIASTAFVRPDDRL